MSKLSNFRQLSVSHNYWKRGDLLSPTHAPITYATVKQGSFCSVLFIHPYSGRHVAFETAFKMFGRTVNPRESENVMVKRVKMPGVMTALVLRISNSLSFKKKTWGLSVGGLESAEWRLEKRGSGAERMRGAHAWPSVNV